MKHYYATRRTLATPSQSNKHYPKP